MRTDRPIYESGYRSYEEHLKSLHGFYSQRREKDAPNIEILFENNVVDRRIFDKEQELVNEYKKTWEQEDTPQMKELKKKIEIFEGIVADQIDGGNWMGDGVEAIATHEIDDILRGVDNVLEFTELNSEGEKIPGTPKEYLGIGFDLVVHKEEDRLKKKLYRFLNEDIKSGTLGTLKYYNGSEIAGELNVFRAVIATDGRTMEDLIKLRIKKDWDGLAEHPFQADMIFQIIVQFQAAVQYALKTGKQEYIEKLRGMATQINKLYDNRQEFLEKESQRVLQSNDYQTMIRFYKSNLGIDI